MTENRLTTVSDREQTEDCEKCSPSHLGSFITKLTTPIVELITWQMHNERCASLGSMLTSSAAFHRRLCRSVFFLNFALTWNPSVASALISAEGLHFSAFHLKCSSVHQLCVLSPKMLSSLPFSLPLDCSCSLPKFLAAYRGTHHPSLQNFSTIIIILCIIFTFTGFPPS